MATKVASLYAEIGADTTKLQTGLKQASTGLTSFDSNLSKSVKSMLGFGAGALGAGIVLDKLVSFTKLAISSASDLAETQSKVGFVFGESAASIKSFGETAALYLGMSENEALAAVGTYGNLFRAMKIGEETSADMSIQLVKLASDLASFNNIDPTVALDKLRAGLSGEVEPLRTLGVNLNEAIIKQKAMTLGLYDGEGAITAAAKAQASYALILEQTTLAQGDFARTSEGLANQQRILNAQWKNLTSELGAGLLPIVTDLVGLMSDAMDGAKRLSYAQSAVNEAIKSGVPMTRAMAREIYAAAYEEYGLEAAITRAVAQTSSQKDMSELLRDSEKGLAGDTDTLSTSMGNLADNAGSAASNIFNIADANTNFTSSIGAMIDELNWINAGGLGIQKVGEEIITARESYKISGEQATTLLRNLAVVSAQTQLQAGGDIKSIAGTLADTLNVSIKEANTLLKNTSSSLSAIQGQFYSYLDIYIRTHGSVPSGMSSRAYSSGALTEDEEFGGHNPNHHATGASFTVPPNFNDNYPILAKSGEKVDITPAGRPDNNPLNAEILKALKDLPDKFARKVRDAILLA